MARISTWNLPVGTTFIVLAYDVTMVVTTKTKDILMNNTYAGLHCIAKWMESRKLKLAPEKTQAELLTTKPNRQN